MDGHRRDFTSTKMKNHHSEETISAINDALIPRMRTAATIDAIG